MLFKGGGMSYLTQLKRCIIKVGICSIMLGLTGFIFANDTNDNLTVEYSASYGTLKVQAQTFYAGKEEGVNRIDYLVVEIFKNQLDNRVYYELFENHLIEDGWIKVELGKDELNPLNIGRALNSDVSWLKLNMVHDDEVIEPVIITINAIANALFATVAKETPTGNLFPEISYKPNNVVMINKHANKFEYISTDELVSRLDFNLDELGYLKTDTQLSDAQVKEIINDSYIEDLGYLKAVDDESLSDREVMDLINDKYIKRIINNSYLDELGYLKIDTNLNDEQIKDMGYIKTDTQLTDDQVKEIVDISYLKEVISDNYIEALGYIKNDTYLSDKDIEAMGYIKTDIDTKLSKDEVEDIIDDGYIRNLGYIKMNSDIKLSYDEPSNKIKLGIWGDIDISDLKDNTDEQDLELSKVDNILSLTEDSTPVDLSYYLDNTDDQTIIFHEDSGYLSITDGGYVDLVKIIRESGLDDQIIEQFEISEDNVLYLEVENSNGVQQVELSQYLDNTDNQELTKDGNLVTLTRKGAENDPSQIDLTEYTKDEQQLEFTDNNLMITNGQNPIYLGDYWDNTDRQELTKIGNIVSLTRLDVEASQIDLSEYTKDEQKLTKVDNLLRLTRVDNDDSEIDLSGYLDNTDNQQLELSGNNLSITAGNQISLSSYLDNTDRQELTKVDNLLRLTRLGSDDSEIDLSKYEQVLSYNPETGNLSLTSGGVVTLSGAAGTDNQELKKLGNIVTLTRVRGDDSEIDLSEYTKDEQELTKVDNLLRLTRVDNDDSEIDLSEYTKDEQELTKAGNILTLTRVDNDNSQIDLTEYTKDEQQLSLVDNKLTLARGGVVSLIPFLDNTDNQELELSGNNLGITAGNRISLSSYLDNTDRQELTKVDNLLRLTRLDSDDSEIDLSEYTKDEQELTKAGNLLTLTRVANDDSKIDLSDYLDNTDNQNIDVLNFSNGTLTVGIENGNSVDVNIGALLGTDDQIIKQFEISADNKLSIAIENGNGVQEVNLSDYKDNTDNQNLELNQTNNILSLTNDSTTVDLSGYKDNTDNQTIDQLSFTGGVLTLAIEDGNSKAVNLGSLEGSDDQKIDQFEIEKNILYLKLESSNGVKDVDLSGYLDNTDNQNLTLTEDTLVIRDGNSVSLSKYLDNTDNQDLTLSGDTLEIEGGESVNLSKYINTDNQTIDQLSFSSGILTVAIEDGNLKTVNLGSLVGSDDQTLTLSGNTLAIRDGNSVSLSKYLDNTDNQDLTLSGDTLEIEDGKSVNLSKYINTDNQDLKLDQNTNILSLTNDNTTVDLSDYMDNTDNQNIDVLSFNTASKLLTVGIEDGDDRQVSLGSLEGSDDQNIESLYLSKAGDAHNLIIGIENGSGKSVDLANLYGEYTGDDKGLVPENVENLGEQYFLNATGGWTAVEFENNDAHYDHEIFDSTLYFNRATSSHSKNFMTNINYKTDDNKDRIFFVPNGATVFTGGAHKEGVCFEFRNTNGDSHLDITCEGKIEIDEDLEVEDIEFDYIFGHGFYAEDSEDKDKDCDQDGREDKLDCKYKFYIKPDSTSIIEGLNANSIISNIYYDKNNTNYYMNLESTSVIEELNANSIISNKYYDKSDQTYYMDLSDWSVIEHLQANDIEVGVIEVGVINVTDIVANKIKTKKFERTSDLRLKKNIETLENMLEKVLQLRGVRFEFKDSDNKDINIGFIAQELEEFFPELVTTGSDGYKSVDYSSMTSVLLEAIKELKNENDDLKERLNQFEKRIKNLESK